MYQTLLASTAALLTACAAASSSPDCGDVGPSPCRAGMVDVTILDRTTGERLTVYSHEGQRWVAGTPGHRYAVSVRSRSPGRILGVVSVDGINVVSGDTAAWGQRGYVLSPRESFDILGWRKSQDRVADFVFTDLPDSYAARTGRPDDVGVIGVAVFREAARVPAPGSLNERVLTTSFERAQDRPDQVIAIRYDRRERLVAMGVIPDAGAPRPFPQSAGVGYVPDPPSRW